MRALRKNEAGRNIREASREIEQKTRQIDYEKNDFHTKRYVLMQPFPS
jgi:hypothetical protein